MSIVKSQEITGKLTHWIKPIHADMALAGKFKVFKGGLLSKPAGLWLSWNGGWEEWCSCESDYIAGKVCLQAKLKPDLKIWLIDSLKDFTDIWDEFTGEPGESARSFVLVDDSFWKWLSNKYHFDAVALTSKGESTTRFETWLYGWDCASILVFDAKNVILSR